MDVYRKYPHFISTDIRTKRGYSHGYNVNPKFMHTRSDILMPESLVKGKSVLDLGCCVAAAGAWVLALGATKYHGVELQHTFAEQARQNLEKSFPPEQWTITEGSVEEFLENSNEHYDIVIASGIMHTNMQYQNFINKIAARSTIIVFEGQNPSMFKYKEIRDIVNAEYLPITEYNDNLMVHEEGAGLKIRSTQSTVGVLKLLLEEHGFIIDANSYDALKIHLPDIYNMSNRFGAVFHKVGVVNKKDTLYLYNNPDKQETYTWHAVRPVIDGLTPNKWKFDDKVAENFVDHARKHIPDYDKVIDLSKEICGRLIKDPMDDKIIDVGCATGETISRLYKAKFFNLVGVDNSTDMLIRCPNLAHYVNSSTFPLNAGPFNAVLCNWTLHFIEDKLAYLKDIYQGLKPGGFLILTDKTANSGIDLELYHHFKRTQGVSDEDIVKKAKSLEGVMFIDSPDWYLSSLKSLGFEKITVINAAPCFTTFLAVK